MAISVGAPQDSLNCPTREKKCVIPIKNSRNEKQRVHSKTGRRKRKGEERNKSNRNFSRTGKKRMQQTTFESNHR